MKIFNKFLLFAGLLFLPLCTQSMGMSSGTKKSDSAVTPLMLAAKANDIKQVKQLILDGADIDSQDKKGRKAIDYVPNECHGLLNMLKTEHLCKSVFLGDRDSVKKQIKHGCNVNGKNILGDTLLSIAARHRDSQMIKLLVTLGANSNVKNSNGYAPKEIAMRLGHKNAMRLLDCAEDKEVKQRCMGNAIGSSSQETLSDCKAVELLKMSNDHKVSDLKALNTTSPNSVSNECDGLNIVRERCSTILQEESLCRNVLSGEVDEVKNKIKNGCNVNCRNIFGDTPLLIAVSLGNSEMVKILLNLGAHINVVNRNGAALSLAAYYGDSQMVRLLLYFGANSDVKNSDGYTPKEIAIGFGHKEAVRVLDCAELINKLDANGNTALFGPAEGHDIREVIRLIKAGINVNIQGNYGNTALQRACIHDNSDKVVDVLLRAKADPTLKDKNASTALHTAAMFGQDKAVDMLLKAKASVDEQDDLGDTALMRAARNDHAKVIEVLCRGGARLDIKIPQDTRIHTGRYTDFSKAHSNFTALDFAREFRRKDAIDALLLWKNNVNGAISDTNSHQACLACQGKAAAAGAPCSCKISN
ncbi:MAG: ankyrin repeat domain-containing protein [Candidatus Dependentiae bacterium]|nr:ankyrin repeat domain-containing protein [Candidatus Dependentiae bacterium]